MDSVKLKRVQKTLGYLILALFVALVAVAALAVKEHFFEYLGRIFKYIARFVFERPWDYKTYLVLLGGAGVSVLAVIWIAYNVIRKRGFLSYVAPLFAVGMVLLGYVVYHYRLAIGNYLAIPEKAGLVKLAVIISSAVSIFA